VQLPGDFSGEAALLARAAGRKAPPVQGTDERGKFDGFGVGRGEQPGRAEGVLFLAERDEFGGPVVPVGPDVIGIVRVLVPAMPADQEAGEHGVVGRGRPEPV
jgi:hypothetical protein